LARANLALEVVDHLAAENPDSASSLAALQTDTLRRKYFLFRSVHSVVIAEAYFLFELDLFRGTFAWYEIAAPLKSSSKPFSGRTRHDDY